MYNYRIIAFLALLLVSPIAWAQDDTPDVPLPAPVRPVAPVGSFGTWSGPSATDDTPIPKGLMPQYLRLAWSRTLGPAPILAIASLEKSLVTVEATRDSKKHLANFSQIFLRVRSETTMGFAPTTEPLPPMDTGDASTSPIVSLVRLPGKTPRLLFSRYDKDDPINTTGWSLSSEGLLTRFSDLVFPDNTPLFALATIENGDSIRLLAHREHRLIFTDSKDDNPQGLIFTDTKIVSASVRVPPVSATSVGDWKGNHKQILAALGSQNNSPVTFTALRGRESLPDTEDEFAPGILAAWTIAGRALPFLVTAQNTGAEEGTDFPEGRVILSLWNASENRWCRVWESGAFGKKICAVATTTGQANLLVVYEDNTGTAHLACLSPIYETVFPKP